MKTRFLLLAGLVAATTLAHLHAAVPLMTSYQGRVKVAGASFTGTGQFKFALLAQPGGVSLWSNDGTSVNGSEPATAVPLAVTDGVFAVLLGDARLPNMQPLRTDLFTANADVSLRVWFDDGVNGSVQLSPDTVLGSAPYAMSASVADNSITGAHLAAGSIVPEKLASVNAPAAGQVLTYDGAGFNWADPATAGSVWSVNGASAYYSGGNIGVGTATPATPLETLGVVRSARNGARGQYLQLDGGDPFGIRLTAQSVAGAEKSLTIRNLSGETTPGVNNSIQFAVGTAASPSTKMTLTKDGNVLMAPGGSGGTIQFGSPNFETGMTIVGANRADVRFDGSALKLLAGEGAGIPSAENGVAIDVSGNVGIGTDSPAAKLHVAGDAVQSVTGKGLPKAMLHIAGDQFSVHIENCYNGVTSDRTAHFDTRCGFAAELIDVPDSERDYVMITFPFGVRDSFFSLSSMETWGKVTEGDMSLSSKSRRIGR